MTFNQNNLFSTLCILLLPLSVCAQAPSPSVSDNEYKNPKITIFTPMCKKGCELGYKVCKFQRREKPETQKICDLSLEGCNERCNGH